MLIYSNASEIMDTLQSVHEANLKRKPYERSGSFAYLEGKVQPHYPVPALTSETAIYPECVVIYAADGLPGITWWNESYNLPLPLDHGQWNPN